MLIDAVQKLVFQETEAYIDRGLVYWHIPDDICSSYNFVSFPKYAF